MVFRKMDTREKKSRHARINRLALRDVALLYVAEIHKKKKGNPLPFDYPFGGSTSGASVSTLFARCSSRVRSYRDEGEEWRRREYKSVQRRETDINLRFRTKTLVGECLHRVR